MMKLYGVPGWGSAISEMMLTLANIPYHFINVDGFDQPGAQREKLLAINPLCQVPTLLLADGSVMTESAAIALMILDERPDLAPPAGTPQRRQFQRLLIWLVANVYPTFTYADYPERWTASAPDELRESCQQITVSMAGTTAGCRALRLGRGYHAVGLLYCRDVQLGAAPRVVRGAYAKVCRRGAGGLSPYGAAAGTA